MYVTDIHSSIKQGGIIQGPSARDILGPSLDRQKQTGTDSQHTKGVGDLYPVVKTRTHFHYPEGNSHLCDRDSSEHAETEGRSHSTIIGDPIHEDRHLLTGDRVWNTTREIGLAAERQAEFETSTG